MPISRSLRAQSGKSVRSTHLGRALLFLLLILGSGTLPAVDLDRQVTLDVAAGTPLEQALLDLVRKADTPLSFATTVVAGYKTGSIKGTFTLADALTTLFKGTSLSFNVVNNGIYVFPSSEATVAVGTPKPPYPPQRPTPPRRSRSESNDADMAEVVIATGSHIPDARATPGTLTLTHAYFEQVGFQTVGEVLRSLSQSFPGGPNPGVISAAGNQNVGTASAASSVDLHGMGSASTLVLLNGQRLATSEASGAVDVTLIPLSAVDRIEVITGGASAVYGSDAVAGTVNIILRDDYQGLEVSGALRSTTDGGGFLQHYSLLAGHAWESGNAYTNFDCGDQQEIDSSQRSFVPAEIAGTTLLPRARYCSTVLKATQAFPWNAVGSLVGMYTTRGTSEMDNLTALSSGVTTSTRSDVTQYAAIATLRVPLGANWAGAFTSSASADDVRSPEQLMLGGVPYQNEVDRFDNHLRSAEANVDGTLLRISPGPVRLAAGTGYNEENFLFTNIPAVLSSVAQRRRIRYLFAETLIPLLPWQEDPDGGPGTLSLQVAGRASWYSDVGSTVNPKVGLLFRPTRVFSMQASWGTSYRAPTLIQQYNISQVSLKFVPDPTAPGGESLVLFDFGGNRRLRPEESSDVTLDLAFTPETIPGALLKVTWYDIDDRKRIGFPTANTGDPIADPNVWPFVVRNPSPANIAQTLAQAQFTDLTGGKYTASQASVLIDDRNQNISRQRATGVDLLTAYGREITVGRLEGSLNLAYLDLRQQVTPESPNLHLSGTAFYPPNLRTRLGLSWRDESYRASIYLNYTGSSRNTVSDPQQPIASWTTVDTSIGYILPGSGHRANTRLTLSAQNLLDRRPPFVSTSQPGAPDVGFDSTNGSAIGRYLTLQITFER